MIEQIELLFHIPDGTDLQSYLVKEVNFSRLFVTLTQLVEPFTQMLNDIYMFLARYQSTARTADSDDAKNKELRKLVISERVSGDLTFDLERFPSIRQSILQPMHVTRPKFDEELKFNHNCSPLYLTEGLLGFGYNEEDAPHYGNHCQECEKGLKEGFQLIFSQLEMLIGGISDQMVSQDWIPEVRRCRHYFNIASKEFKAGIHAQERCAGYNHWKEILYQFLWKFEQISTEETWIEEIEAFLRFFELPFWQKRSQLYEVWTLIHFLGRLNPAPVLNIQEGTWKVMYAKAEEPVAWVHTDCFELEVWFQRYQVGKTYSDTHAMPDIQILGRTLRKKMNFEPLVLIECKEQEGESLADMQKLASHYHNQVQPKRAIYCNYLDYSQESAQGYHWYGNRGEIFCDGFRPGSPNVALVDKAFRKFLKRRIRWYETR